MSHYGLAWTGNRDTHYAGLNLCHVGHSQLWGNLISWKKSEKFNLAFLQRWQTVHTWKFSTAVLVISIVKILVVAFTVLITAHAQFLADRHLTAMQWCVQAVLWCTHCTAVDNAAIYTKTTDFQLPLRFHKCATTGMLTVKGQPWKSSWMSHKIIIIVLATLTIQNGRRFQDSIQLNTQGY